MTTEHELAIENWPGSPDFPGPVHLRMPADSRQLPILRCISETMALLGDFPIDDASDLKLAADEVCSMLLTHAAAEATLDCEIAITEDLFIFVAAVRVTRKVVPESAGLSWRILETIADTVSVQHTPVADAATTGPASTDGEAVPGSLRCVMRIEKARQQSPASYASGT